MPFDLNGGFAAPDPKYEDWKPPADAVPVSGNGKDSRFREDNMWATTPMRPKRPNPSPIAMDRSQSSSSSSDPSKPKPLPKLDGTGSWGDFGVKEAATARAAEDASDKIPKGYSTVPNTIEGMDEVLQERVRMASAKSTAAYASASASAATKAEKAAVPMSSTQYWEESVAPHERETDTDDEALARRLQAAEFGNVRSAHWL